MPAGPLLVLLSLSAALPVAVRAQEVSPATPAIVSGVPRRLEGRVLALSCLLRFADEADETALCSRASHTHGATLSLLETDTGRIYVFAGATPATDPADRVGKFLAEEVVVEGRVYERAGHAIVVAESIAHHPDAPTP